MSAKTQSPKWLHEIAVGVGLSLVLPIGILFASIVSERLGAFFLFPFVLFGGLIQLVYLLPIAAVAYGYGHRGIVIGLALGDGILVLFNVWALFYSGMELP